jgi:YegS/Rv2252/BmrU family lipid kinase
MKYILLINKFSLKKQTQKMNEKITEYCKKNKLDYKIEINSEDCSTEDILKKYTKSKDIIICIGGDGTINRVLNMVANTKNILGYIPFGTGNDFYRTNKELLKKGINKIDLVKINDKYFINTACFGVDADIANSEKLVHSSILPKSQRYNMSIVKNLLIYKPRHLKLVINEKEYEDDYNTVVLCNGRYYGGGYKIGPKALLDDGILDIYLAKKTSKIKLIKLLLNIKSGKHEFDNSIERINAKKVYIESKNKVMCNIDGEILESNKFNVEVIPKGINIYYNQEMIDEILQNTEK